jgi:hypothetical protein
MHSMMLAPHNGKIVVIVVFHDEALKRIEQHDPAIIEGFLADRLITDKALAASLKLVDLDFMFCYESDEAGFTAKARELRDPKAILQWLGRGWENKPEERDEVLKIVSLKGE